ncbi:DUF429 domain-containing protein [Undibacterium griseum]|uniref:DUF429 domain-containing protein n=1 Tax=Undibacterium griseum TaxID=2762295 RepID=A0ABR6YJS3_9BURK|nr:DUF429 domain-containing protein [Undibacterium griseum]MBC3884157.1 DUF429 domain-containing protein [Undibacterium griseum]
MKLFGVDFTSAPSRRKAITIAGGIWEQEVLQVQELHRLTDFGSFEQWLRQDGPWLAGFDLPFSLPRELVQTLAWPLQWAALMRHLQTVPRAELRAQCKAFCDARPAGQKFAHRQTDRPAGSSPSMKWVNPPVAYMLHAGAPRLLQAGVSIPGMVTGDPQRIAVEAYPGMVARSVTKNSYKSDDPAKHTIARRDARMQIIAALEAGTTPWRIRVDCSAVRESLIEDGSADLLDAVLCQMLAAWSWQRREQQFGMPLFDPLEGWIAGCDVLMPA